MSGGELADLPRMPPAPEPPPIRKIGWQAWLRQNLFNSWLSGLLTVVVGVALVCLAILSIQWVINARWEVVTQNLRLFLMGQYPIEHAWRVWLTLAILSVLAGVTAASSGGPTRALATWLAAGQAMLGLLMLASPMGVVAALATIANGVALWIAFLLALRRPIAGRTLGIVWLVYVPVALILLHGLGGTPLEVVPARFWGGLLLTFLLSISGIVLSFPVGVLLALGRRSDMRLISGMSTAFIEIVRGVPLITILFMASILLPLFLPGDLRIDAVLRAIGGITIFSAAYVAENVRGGLQAIPSGQIEAANAIGLNAFQRNVHIVLPQALRSVIPANVGLFISLLKDTTLVFIAGGGLLELLGVGRSVLAQPAFLGAHLEVYVFISVVFFVLCYAMSQASYRLEAAMGVGTR
ncbi:MAG TPA: amino acid ABC transporter permease [Candidatus Limnocylindrales bacterium]|nr:amino acid ABC transporter permease [Candidatus Limnocylindrales bacterium]